ncbi:hypothetical protein HMPREF0661_00620 [Prevotella melaninogenica DNF00666]|uniref:Uncharacterized protein n=1 Tax=Prevotella melaninogenica DNF00666 TaxID=1401073 RepID=A0A096BDE6_9BACT|nr:hypothetical protein HMPREF0661_00620 [Prevotella melaninogenica DNF00666]
MFSQPLKRNNKPCVPLQKNVALPQTGHVLWSNDLFRLYYGWFYKLALLDFELIFEVKMQESEEV